MKGCSTLKTKEMEKTQRKRSSSSKKMKATDHGQVLNPTPLSQIPPPVLSPSTKNTVDEIIVLNSQPLSEPPPRPPLSPSTMNTGDEIIIVLNPQPLSEAPTPAPLSPSNKNTDDEIIVLNPQPLSEVPPAPLLKPKRKKYDVMRPNTHFYDGTRYGLPPGWLVEMRTRENSKKVDQFYYEPETYTQFRSRVSVDEYLRKQAEAAQAAMQALVQAPAEEAAPGGGIEVANTN